LHRGFNLSVPDACFANYVSHGRGLHGQNKARVQSSLDSFKDREGAVIASKLSAEWFPGISANVFISHSHRDSALAVGLAGYLDRELGVSSFIDSCTWGYSEEILKILDDEYCYQPTLDSYSYDKRNKSTAHVYMMLVAAITQMLNACECVMFLNTPQSIVPGDSIGGQTTESPWIFAEIAMTKLIQTRSPKDHRRMLKSEAALRESMRIRHPVTLGHLEKLSVADLNQWVHNSDQSRGTAALDRLYELKA